MERKPIVIVGAGGHAKTVIEIIEEVDIWEITGVVGVEAELGKKILGYEVMYTDADLKKLRKNCNNAVIGIGQIRTSKPRQILAKKLKAMEYKLPNIIANNAHKSKYCEIGEGNVLGHGSVINTKAVIGNFNIINTNSVIEHDVQVGDYCHISTGTIINGEVRVGSRSFIGSGAIIRERIIIPEDTLISAGKRIMGWPERL